MDRGRKALPTLNKHTDSKFYSRCQSIHKKKLSTIKSCIDNSEPTRPAHLRKNLKKEQMKEERYATIERENRILLEKMSFIMQHDTLDNKNDSIKHGHSLNKGQRKRDLQRITAENQSILRRIQTRQPTYDHVQWEEEAKLHEKYAQNIREYPERYAGVGEGDEDYYDEETSRLQYSSSAASIN
ncbi:hypothetical protein SDRG_03249 [Saprolegnia diclina VS20]|uniref:Uncharacterized protein n=1 Tax=Saprolegnia diclina (strain VS20) TaxID=1156394 RepID=T0QNY7_SAPDV|nr:hypothetical protein SDRG_03249 [Saprolegnia diclina VS20]EQC39829.1 hypothetical protein SDRG_03249 [Saprolegnia diclina VS20]|eukprot:XP_008607101.1 hypothetical protein SDRG_03249 [Saprolegnia diclina VS20]